VQCFASPLWLCIRFDLLSFLYLPRSLMRTSGLQVCRHACRAGFVLPCVTHPTSNGLCGCISNCISVHGSGASAWARLCASTLLRPPFGTTRRESATTLLVDNIFFPHIPP
jgi:hypothetical protein